MWRTKDVEMWRNVKRFFFPTSPHPHIFTSLYLNPRIIAIFFLGFSSGLPLALTASTLSVWLKEANVSLSSIGLFAAVTTPYALKFLWSPLMDGMPFPLLSHLLGRRRGWLMATQLGLVISIMLLGLADPVASPWQTALMALLVAIFSASQDIVIDAYRVEILKPEQYGAGAASVVFGYRIGMIVSSAGALFLASHVSWLMTYWIMAAFMGIGMVTVLLNKEPESGQWQAASGKKNERLLLTTSHRSLVTWFQQHIIAPFADFMRRPHWLMILFFILLYKLGDAFMGVMTNPFLIDIGFTKDQIATVVKLYGVIATIVGSFIGGSMVFRLGAMRSLWICGIAHGITNLMFVWLANTGVDTHLLALAITCENITGGMGTAAFVAFMSGLITDTRFTATQYALLSSFASFGRTWLSTPAGWFAATLGWSDFFLLAAALALPGLIVLWLLSKKLNYKTK
jgi:PAT family beta-lactamase induction signal transducer AmpG